MKLILKMPLRNLVMNTILCSRRLSKTVNATENLTENLPELVDSIELLADYFVHEALLILSRVAAIYSLDLEIFT